MYGRVFLLFLLMLPELSAYGADSCWLRAKRKDFIGAGQCYEAKAKILFTNGRTSRFWRIQKGIYLSKAAKAYEIAAFRQKRIDVKAYWRERAAFLLQKYLKEHLCSREYYCLLIRGRLMKLRQSIGYSWLIIRTKSKIRAQILLRGYRFNRSFRTRGLLRLQVRPGRYRIDVLYPQHRRAVCYASVAPRVFVEGSCLPKRVVSRRRGSRKAGAVSLAHKKAPLSRSSANWLVPAGMILGGLFVVGGGVMMSLGYVEVVSFRNRANHGLALIPSEAQQAAQELSAKEAIERYERGRSQISYGWLVSGVGVGILGATFLFHILSRKVTPSPRRRKMIPSPRPVAPTKKASSSRSFLLFLL